MTLLHLAVTTCSEPLRKVMLRYTLELEASRKILSMEPEANRLLQHYCLIVMVWSDFIVGVVVSRFILK